MPGATVGLALPGIPAPSAVPGTSGATGDRSEQPANATAATVRTTMPDFIRPPSALYCLEATMTVPLLSPSGSWLLVGL